LNSENKGQNKQKWGHGKLRLHDDTEKFQGKKLVIKKAKLDLAKVECFNCDNHRHLVKDCPKLLQINDYIFQGKKFFSREICG
jgi:hypothetical protein